MRVFALMAVVLVLAASHAAAVRVVLETVDPDGRPLPARVSVIDANGEPFPGHPDSTLFSHNRLHGYFYSPGTVAMDLPLGNTDIVVAHGFEWRPASLIADVRGDTVLTVCLQPLFDMRSRGWFSGDAHLHTDHGAGGEYTIHPEDVRLIGHAEDLAQVWCLDYDYNFSGAPDPASDSLITIYYATEFRNMSLGHAGLLGVQDLMGCYCCSPPNSVAPMLCDIRDIWRPQAGQAQVIAHPHTGAGFFDDDEWPGTGVARELPVLAALNRLDALDVMSYSNVPDVYLEDWYRLMSCGMRIGPSVGTDTSPQYYERKPAGGYRVYVQETPGQPHDQARWVDGLRAGHSFVTNYPLIPIFTVNGVAAGDVLELSGPSADVELHLRVESVLDLGAVSILRNGFQIARFTVPPGDSLGVVVDTTLQMNLTESAWIAARVDGQTTLRCAVAPAIMAHTAPVHVHLDGVAPRRPADAAHFLDQLDSLAIFAELRDHWNTEQEHGHVMSLIDAARGFYRSFFTLPPDPFNLLAPAESESLDVSFPVRFAWNRAIDPEWGDRVTYLLELSPDTLFTQPQILAETSACEVLLELDLPLHETFWWRVRAHDLGGNETMCSPPACSFYVERFPSGEDQENPIPQQTAPGLHVWPNPSTGRVTCRLGPDGGGSFGLRVYDIHGRCVAALPARTNVGGGLMRGADGAITWLGNDAAGHRLPSGLYWLRLLPDPSAAEPEDIRPTPILILR